MRLKSGWRKALLTFHVTASVSWLGISGVLLTLGIAGPRGANPATVYPAIGLIGETLLVPLSVIVWVVGVFTSLLTPWGMIKYWWVTIKLVATTILTTLVLFALWPTLRLASDPSTVLTIEDKQQIVIAPAVSVGVLIGVSLLSTFKPWGRNRLRRW